MSLKFYFDSNVIAAVTIQLRKNGITAVRCQEVGMADASDPEHLAYATQNGYIMVSFDADFLELHARWLSQNQPHAGIMRLDHNLQGSEGIGRIVKALIEYHDMIEVGVGTIEDDIVNHLFFIK